MFSGNADFTITNTKTNNTLRFQLLILNDYENEFIGYCLDINNKETNGLGTIGKFKFNSRDNESEPIIFKYTDISDKGIRDTIAYNTLTYLFNHKRLPKFISIQPHYCGVCCKNTNLIDGFCENHIETKENLFDCDFYFT